MGVLMSHATERVFVRVYLTVNISRRAANLYSAGAKHASPKTKYSA